MVLCRVVVVTGFPVLHNLFLVSLGSMDPFLENRVPLKPMLGDGGEGNECSPANYIDFI